jgi:hypothetical protein
MNYWLSIIFIVAAFNGCAFNKQDGRFAKSSIQTIDMGTFNGLRIIEIASVNFLKDSDKTTNPSLFTEIDQENLSDSLIRSFKKSGVQVVPSAQTKIHLDFTEFVILEEEKGSVFKMNANVAVSRNGIVTRKVIEINGKDKLTLGRTKDNGVKIFILGLADLLREQATFKR